MMKDTNMVEGVNEELARSTRQTMIQGIARLQERVSKLEATLADRTCLDGDFALVMDEGRLGVRVYGNWEQTAGDQKFQVKGWKHISQLEWHICGTFGYEERKARQAVLNLSARDSGSHNAHYSYVHFRQLRETVLARLKKSVAIVEEQLAKI